MGSRVQLDVEGYLGEVLSLVKPLPDDELVTLEQARGRTLAAPVIARCTIPPFANSAMDGFAVRAAEVVPGEPMAVVAEVLAGSPRDPDLPTGACVRIMTGAPVPSAADTVVPLEDVTTLPDGRIRVDAVVQRGRNVRRAGEDVRAGEVVLDAGIRLDATSLSAAAACGVDAVRCVRYPQVGVVATGDELVPPGGELRRGQIYESNATFLQAAIVRDGGCPVTVTRVPDDEAALARVLDDLAARCDLIVVSGGVSVGDADVTRLVLESHGAQFRHVRMQPGKPQGWARWGDHGVPVLALPGNPLSAAISYEVFVSAVLDRLCDRPNPGWTTAVAAHAWTSPAGRRQFIPVTIDVDAGGRQLVRPSHQRGSASHMVTSLARAHALASVGENVTQVEVGDLVTIRRFRV